jgi:primosomal protein N' (replication factor Y)
LNTILKIAIPIPIHKVFDYLPPESVNLKQLKPGQRLLVPFGKQTRIGYLIEVSTTTEALNSKLKQAEVVLDEQPLISKSELSLLFWASHYYHHPVGEVISNAFPIALRKGGKAELPPITKLVLTDLGSKIHQKELLRAPRQAALIHLLQNNAPGLYIEELNHLEWNWRGAARALTKKELVKIVKTAASAESLPKIPPPLLALNKEQEQAVSAISNSLGHFKPFLLEGITGSGKTEVYLRLIQETLERGQQVMVLLPEISLTPQLEARFQARFPIPIATYHSGLSEQKRLHHWLRFQNGDWPILLGTRSATFIPMKNPGLIIVDEEHDNSFKQQEGFRFSARDIAIVRAQQLHVPILLGTATPSLESLLNCQRKRYQHLHLTKRAGNASPPKLQLLDLRNKKLVEELSPELINATRKTIARGEQVLLFLNRRGFAPTWICHSCGYTADCNRCHAKMVFHKQTNILRCHHCGKEKRPIPRCPKCRQSDLQPLGVGTERIEQVLNKLFPKQTIARIDRDTTRRKGELNKVLEQVNNGEINILLGTQMLAKGHHFPNVTLVGILDIDHGLFSYDYRASEKMAQMIIQVAGRAGREEKPGYVLLQTRHPDHPLLASLIHQGYGTFAREALLERSAAQLPPITHQALMRCEAADQSSPPLFLSLVAELAENLNIQKVEILGPVPAPMERRAGRYRYQLLLQSHEREPLHTLLDRLVPEISKLRESKKVRWSIDVDPVDLY